MIAEKVKMMVLGCPKNRADSEAVAGLLKDAGFEVVLCEKEADAAILFTCAFVRDAEEESIGAIVELGEQKRRGKIRALLVVGCMPERHRAESGVSRDLPDVDAWVGAADYRKLPQILKNALDGKRHFPSLERTGFLPERAKRLRLGHEPFSYLKISEGCRNRCAYCTIPYIKGDFRSRPFGQLVEEAAKLAAAGAKEIVIVGQDTALYGIDRYGQPKLADLLKKLASRLPKTWLRVMYCHPAHLNKSLFETIAEFPNICPYMDVPVQHVSNSVLRRMGRRVTKKTIERTIENARKTVPGMVLRTTVMVGFPGETDAEFRELLEFVKAIRFERLGAFAYSREEGTRAFDMPGQIPEKIKLDRLDITMRTQQEISWDINQDLIGKQMIVLVDGVAEDNPDSVAARSMAHAPEVDGRVYIRNRGFNPGDFLKVRITDALLYDLEAEPITAENQKRSRPDTYR